MGFRSAALVAFGALLVLGAGAATFLILRAKGPAHSDRAESRLGPVTLAYPLAYARFSAGRTGGQLDSLELALEFPEFAAAGEEATLLPADQQAHARTMVFLTLRPQDESLDPADRTAKVHARFLEPDIWQEGSGLIMRRFERGSPYDHEELHFVPPEGRIFAARCTRPSSAQSDLPSTCLSTLRVDGLDIDFRFPPALLPQWDRLSDGIRGLVDSFVVR